jgi:hypothetical protein
MYGEVADFLSKQKGNFSVLALPLAVGSAITLDWADGGYDGPAPLSDLISHPVVSSLADGYPSLLALGSEAGSDEFSQMLAQAADMGCRYVVLQGNVRPEVEGGLPSVPTADSSAIETGLKQSGSTELASYGDLQVWRIPASYVRPMVYAIDAGLSLPLGSRVAVTDVHESPTSWQVTLSGARGSTLLVLNQSYNQH